MQIETQFANSPKVYVPENRLGYPERRKMYRLNDRHNLSSSIDITWLNSLQDNQMKKSKIQEKKHEGYDKIINNYNKYVDRQLNERFQPLKFATIAHDHQPEPMPRINDTVSGHEQRNNNGKMNSSQVINNESSRYDRTLNAQIQSFNDRNENRKNSFSLQNSHPNSNSGRRNVREPYQFREEAKSLNPHFLKQLLLRSALDRPEVYSKFSNGEMNPFRNVKPDNLETYLRIGQKKTNF